ncbi:sigma-70 family RNA polymerase sigma factor [Fodinicola acaciae]|uniref:sigma-70 family RNA polymerase sigma factor n=1 Tax=Fodinicola acaciae TaxID=2681555 RepID=UPI0013D8A56E|nr:sigma-70 family RNA polymerase sigma factor [Fodinicola acaciae]
MAGDEQAAGTVTEEPPAGPHDGELITAARAGDADAYEQLYRRHSEAALRYAASLAKNPADRDDLVSEAFAKVLSTLKAGGGPDIAFRSYLLSVVRNTFYDRTRKEGRVDVTDDMERHDQGVAFTDTVVEGEERSLAARAFATLPERWQMVLWHTEVEGDSPAEVAPLLGLTANGVAALAYRARERLKQAYLSVHVSDVPTSTVVAGTTCGWTVERLGAKVRGGLSKREASKVDAHLADCAQCTVLFAELGELNSSLRGVLAPLILGAAVAGYFIKPAAIMTGAGAGLTGLFHWVPVGAQRVRDFSRTPAGRATAAGFIIVMMAVAAAAFVATSGDQKPPPPRPVAAPPAPAQPAPAQPAPAQPAPARPAPAQPAPPPAKPPKAQPPATPRPLPSPKPKPPSPTPAPPPSSPPPSSPPPPKPTCRKGFVFICVDVDGGPLIKIRIRVRVDTPPGIRP